MKIDNMFFSKKITFKKIYFAMLILITLLPGALTAQNYVVGVQNFKEYLPYSTYQNNDYSGFNRELLDLFASVNGYNFEYRALPIKRLYSDFLEGKVDLKYPDSPFWSKNLKEGIDVIYSDALVEYIDGVIVKTERLNAGIESLKTLGMIGGFTPFAYLGRINDNKISVQEVFNIEGLLRQVNSGRVDGAYLNTMVSQYYIDKTLGQGTKLVFDPDLPFSKGTRHLSTIKYPELIANFNKFLIEHKAEVDTLKEKYKVILDY